MTRQRLIATTYQTLSHHSGVVPLQLLHDKAMGRCAGENCPHKNMRPPQCMADDFAAAQVLDAEAQVTVPLVGLKQCVVGVRPKELEKKKERKRDRRH